MRGVTHAKLNDGSVMLTITDRNQAVIWKKQIQETKKILKRKDLTPKERKQYEDNIVILDTYIFLSGERYSLRGGKEAYK